MKRLNDLRGQTFGLMYGFHRAAMSNSASAKLRLLGGRLRACLHRGEQGQSAVEFALVLPMLLMTVTFIFAICMAMLSYEQLEAATSNAAFQQLATARNVTADPCSAIETSVSTTLSNWTASKFVYTVTIQNSSGTAVTYGPTTGTGFSCTAAYTVLAADSANTSGTLTVSYPYSWIPVYLINLKGSLSATQAVNVN